MIQMLSEGDGGTAAVDCGASAVVEGTATATVVIISPHFIQYFTRAAHVIYPPFQVN